MSVGGTAFTLTGADSSVRLKARYDRRTVMLPVAGNVHLRQARLTLRVVSEAPVTVAPMLMGKPPDVSACAATLAPHSLPRLAPASSHKHTKRGIML